MRLKKLTRVKKSRRSNRFTLAMLAKRFAHVKNAQGFTWEAGTIAIGAAAICIAVGAMLSTALRTGADAEGSTASAPMTAAPPPQRADARLAPPAEMASKPAAPKAAAADAPVTITGCLEYDDDVYRLKDTSGAQAPKARSWKSGFLKKNSATIAIVDAADRARLPNHVGQRVVVTGTLVDREMQVRSLRPVASSCHAA
jgi:hypothetical protein